LAGKPNVFRPYKDKEYMIELYVNKRLSAKECAELLGCGENILQGFCCANFLLPARR
jgi:hypothetical protein